MDELVMDKTVANAPVLEVRGLTKRFGGLTAVKNLSFDLRAGEIFGLIGPNGSGKSTAMKSVMGIERPTAGEVVFLGIPRVEVNVLRLEINARELGRGGVEGRLWRRAAWRCGEARRAVAHGDSFLNSDQTSS